VTRALICLTIDLEVPSIAILIYLGGWDVVSMILQRSGVDVEAL